MKVAAIIRSHIVSLSGGQPAAYLTLPIRNLYARARKIVPDVIQATQRYGSP
jgi:hypothetical protein